MAAAAELVLDLNSDAVVYALVALDTELNQLQRLWIEQGPFFKTLFVEVVSDGERFGLKEHTARQAANASHVSQDYWKKTIPCSDIENVRRKVAGLMHHWGVLYPHLMRATMWPDGTVTEGSRDPKSERSGEPGARHARHVPASGLTVLDAELQALHSSILDLCGYLLSDKCAVPRAALAMGTALTSPAPFERMLARLRPGNRESDWGF